MVYKSDWFAFKSFAFLMDKSEPKETETLSSEEITVSKTIFFFTIENNIYLVNFFTYLDTAIIYIIIFFFFLYCLSSFLFFFDTILRNYNTTFNVYIINNFFYFNVFVMIIFNIFISGY